jgi:hypothetical protein
MLQNRETRTANLQKLKVTRLAVSCSQSIAKASNCGHLRVLTSEFGWDLVLLHAIWPIAVRHRLIKVIYYFFVRYGCSVMTDIV